MASALAIDPHDDPDHDVAGGECHRQPGGGRRPETQTQQKTELCSMIDVDLDFCCVWSWSSLAMNYLKDVDESPGQVM